MSIRTPIESLVDSVEVRPRRDVSWTRALLWVLVPVMLLLSLAWAQDQVPVIELLREPKGDADVPAYTGAVTSFGLYLWSGSIAVAGLTVAVLWSSRTDRELRWFLAVGMAISSGFLLDDRFLIHESVAPGFGIMEEAVVVAHGLFVVAWLLAFPRVVSRTDWLVLAIALFLFVSSMAIDQAPDAWVPVSYEVEYFVEEVAKVLGIVVWFLYFFIVAVETVAPSSPEDRPDDRIIDLR